MVSNHSIKGAIALIISSIWLLSLTGIELIATMIDAPACPCHPSISHDITTGKDNLDLSTTTPTTCPLLLPDGATSIDYVIIISRCSQSYQLDIRGQFIQCQEPSLLVFDVFHPEMGGRPRMKQCHLVSQGVIEVGVTSCMFQCLCECADRQEEVIVRFRRHDWIAENPELWTLCSIQAIAED